jgi:hypothetical protein
LLDEFGRDLLSGDESLQFCFGYFPEAPKIGQLVRESVIRVVEPESPAPAFFRAAMHAKRRSDRVAKFTRTDLILAGKDLDSFG